MISAAELHDLMGKWWFNYDEGNFDILSQLLTDDAHFTVRTDSDDVAWAEFARADVQGREAVMEWQEEHRRNSPYPLRHHGANAHLVENRDGEASYGMYINVTQVVNEMPSSLPGGVVRGNVRQVGGVLMIASMDVVLDTITSDLFAIVRPQQ